jgi:glycosyltransferase involved in cell wall biosynthesis
MKKVLIISYFFPPLGGVGVQRTLKFVKYLPQFGWMPTVLSVKSPDYYLSDPDLLREIPKEAKVIRTYSFEPTKLFKFGRSIFDVLMLRLKNKKKRKGGSDFIRSQKPSFFSKMNSFLFIPDNKVGWLPFTLWSLVYKLRKDKIDVIYSTSPPSTSLLVGFMAKLLLKKPWVIDLRDLWSQNPYLMPITRFHLRIIKLLEKRVFIFADKIITVSDGLQMDLIESYPYLNSEKFEVITNGYDSEDFSKEINDGNKRFSIGHVGTLYAGQTPFYFIQALGLVKKELPELEKYMAVTFIGEMDRNNRRILEKQIQNLQLQDIVIRKEAVSHREAIDCMLKFDLLLFILGKEYKGCLTGKLFEYLAAQKPVLALAEDGPACKLIRETQSGVVVDPQDTEQIKETIINCFESYRKGSLKIQPKMEVISIFERKRLTQQLVGIFDELRM